MSRPDVFAHRRRLDDSGVEEHSALMDAIPARHALLLGSGNDGFLSGVLEPRIEMSRVGRTETHRIDERREGEGRAQGDVPDRIRNLEPRISTG